MKVPTFSECKAELRATLGSDYSKKMAYKVEVAAAARLAFLRVVADIEALKCAVQREGEDLDFVAALDESIRELPRVQANYEKALIALGLADAPQAEEAPKVGRPAKPVTVDDATELNKLMQQVAGNSNSDD